ASLYDWVSVVAVLVWCCGALLDREPASDDAFDLVGIGQLWERCDPERAVACYRAALALGLPAPIVHAVRLRLASWEKRRLRWDAACALWEEVASAPSFDPRPSQ